MNDHETDLSKASRMAIPKDKFAKLVEGDLQACFSFLHYLNSRDSVKEAVINEMYEDHLKKVAEKETPELMVENDD